MNQEETRTHSAGRRAMLWVGRILSTLVVLGFAMSAAMKLKGGPEVTEGMTHLGLPESLILPLAIVELSCAAVYAIPATSVLGAILLTGYLGGAICAHVRVGDPFVVQTILGVCVWLGVYLREPRLSALLPLRTLRRGER